MIIDEFLCNFRSDKIKISNCLLLPRIKCRVINKNTYQKQILLMDVDQQTITNTRISTIEKKLFPELSCESLQIDDIFVLRGHSKSYLASNECLYFRIEVHLIVGHELDPMITSTLSNLTDRHIILTKAFVFIDSEYSKSFEIYLDEIVLIDAGISLQHSMIQKNEIPIQQHQLEPRQSNRIRINLHAMPLFVAYLICTLLFITLFDLCTGIFPNILLKYTQIALLIAAILLYIYFKIQLKEITRLSTRVFFANGWNAWSFCGSILQGAIVPFYALPHQFSKSFHFGTEALLINARSRNTLLIRDKDPHIGSDFYTLLADRVANCGIVVGFLSQHKHFGYISTNYMYDRLTVSCECDGILVCADNERVETDWLCLHFQHELAEEPLACYMNIAGRFNKVKPCSVVDNSIQSPLLPAVNVPTGWCSWYHFFRDIDEKILLDNIASMKTIQDIYFLQGTHQGFKLFQIDDGYQSAWGDWSTLDATKFSSLLSMETVMQRVREAGFIPGIWMAPFACDKFSTLAKEHPNWILKKSGSNKPVNSAFCGKWFYALDCTLPEVQEHIKRSISCLVNTWGCRYLKLDFLYAAVIGDAKGSFFDRTKTRAEIFQNCMAIIKEAAGEDVFLLGCGAPMGSVIGHVHANRVSSDAGLCWFPEFPSPSYDTWNLPSARNMVQNSINRMPMHNRWWINDPDCMLLRKTTSFSDEEIIGMATVKALTGGSFILSDDLVTLPQDRVRVAQQVIPPTNIAAIAVDLLEQSMPELLRVSYFSRGNKIRIENLQREDAYSGSSTSSPNPRNPGKASSPLRSVLTVLSPPASACSTLISSIDTNRRWGLFAMCNWSDRKTVKSFKVSDAFSDQRLLQSIAKEHAAFKTSTGHNFPLYHYHLTFRPSKLPSRTFIASDDHDSALTNELVLTQSTTSLAIDCAVTTSASATAYFLLHILEFWSDRYCYGIIEVNLQTLKVTKLEILSPPPCPSAGLDLVEHIKVSMRDGNQDQYIECSPIPVHSSKLFAFRIHDIYEYLHRKQDSHPIFIGSNLHFSCGYELQSLVYSKYHSPPLSPPNTYASISTSNPAESLPLSYSHSYSHRLDIIFKEGALKDNHWNGFIWMFLPTSHHPAAKLGTARGTRSSSTNSSRSKIRLTGATPSPEHYLPSLTPPIHHTPLSSPAGRKNIPHAHPHAHAHSLASTEHDKLLPSSSTSSSSALTGPQLVHARTAIEVCEIVEPIQRQELLGSVWKIPVCINVHISSPDIDSASEEFLRLQRSLTIEW